MGRYSTLAVIGTLLMLIVAAPLFAEESEGNKPKPSVKQINAKDASELIEKNRGNDDFIILDVRTKEEYSEGHIENAVNIDVTSSWFIGDVEKLGEEKTFLVHCRSGSRSERAIAIMKESGFTDIYEISGGFSEWESEGLPVTKQ